MNDLLEQAVEELKRFETTIDKETYDTSLGTSLLYEMTCGWYGE